MQRIGLALVGCGAIAQWHRMALASVPALEIRACVDPLRERAEAMAKQTGMVGENAQYWPDVLLAKQLIESGAIGTPVTAHAHLFSPAMPEFHGPGSWRLSRERMGGGVALDTGSHFMRPLRMWLGEIDAVVAVMERPLARMEGESLTRALSCASGAC